MKISKFLYCRYSSAREQLSRKRRSIVKFNLSAFKFNIRNYMIERNNISKTIFKIFLFVPLIFYYGKRSYIAFDEGFYALQARWIIEKDNWIIPLWWDDYVLDRTNGLQILIAK